MKKMVFVGMMLLASVAYAQQRRGTAIQPVVTAHVWLDETAWAHLQQKALTMDDMKRALEWARFPPGEERIGFLALTPPSLRPVYQISGRVFREGGRLDVVIVSMRAGCRRVSQRLSEVQSREGDAYVNSLSGARIEQEDGIVSLPRVCR